ncbi:MAG TPA: prefoldin subunit alpha [Thermoplasmata archaeon]|nr:prefoldin subunit alpha [Thermoplasmata archaeon]
MSSVAPPRDAEQQIQEDLVRLEAYRSQLSAMLQQHQYLTASRGDHLRSREALEGLERAVEGSEILIPLGADAFLRGTAHPEQKVLLGLGAGVVVELEAPKASEMLAERLTKLDQAARDLEGQIGTLEQRIEAMSQRVEALSRSTSAPPAGDVGRD